MQDIQQLAVMRVSGMPRRARPLVEEAMYCSLKSLPMATMPGTEVLDVAHCTPWMRSPEHKGCVECKQLLNGTAEELEALRRALSRLTAEHAFSASLEIVG